MVLGLIANVGTAIGSEVAGSLLDKSISGVGKKSFGQIIGDTLSDPWTYVPFGGLIKELFVSKQPRRSKGSFDPNKQLQGRRFK